MAYKYQDAFFSSMILLDGFVTFLSLYIPCIQIGACPNVPNIHDSPAWPATFILLLSVFGLALSINGWEGIPLARMTFLALAVLGAIVTVLCVVVIAIRQPQSLLASKLRIGLIVESLFLCAVSAVAAVLSFRDCNCTVQLPVVVKQKVAYRGAGGRDANVASVSGALPVGSRAGVGVSAPSTAQPTTTGLPVIPSGPEHIYSTRIANEAPTAPQQQSYYQPLIFNKGDAGGSSNSSASAGLSTLEGFALVCVRCHSGMAYKYLDALLSSLLLFGGLVTFLSLYNPCTQIGACPNVPNIHDSPAWPATLVLLLSLSGLAMSINGWEGIPLARMTFLVLAILGVLVTVLCVVFIAIRQPQSLLASELWISIILVSLFLCAVSAVAAALFFRDCNSKVQLLVVRKKKVAYRGAGGRYVNVASVGGALPVGSRAGVGVSAPSTAQSTTTGLPGIPSGPEHIYSTRIADEAPTAPQQQSYYQPLIFDKFDAEGSSSSSAAAAAAASQAGSPGGVAGRPSAVASPVPPVTDRPGVSTDDADIKTYENLK